jgi:hypothetical protein
MVLSRNIKRNLSNLPGWRTNRKIVVIESDDWGSIRMPSRLVYKKLLDAGLNLNGGDGLRYSLYDSLANSSDLGHLYQILFSFRDINNVSAVFTANSVVANPDFEKIRESGYQQYYYEPFTETLKKYFGGEATFNLWKEGICNRVFVPQFHGREHLNISEWMKSLRVKDHETMLAFNEGMWAFVPKQSTINDLQYEAAFQLSETTDLEKHRIILIEGLDLFENLFGYKAEYFVPPNGIINNKLNSVCSEKGIKYRNASKIQRITTGNGRTNTKIHWLGQKEANGIRYIIRNCVFEPSKPGKDWVDSCMYDIKIAFCWNKPAIINTHRVNYIGVHDVLNRDKGLKELKRLLSAIKRNWLNVEFMTTDQLGMLIESENKS